MNKAPQHGFTLLELLVIVVFVGILASVTAPAWMRFLARHHTTIAQEKLRQGIQQAQLKSQQESVSWQFSAQARGG